MPSQFWTVVAMALLGWAWIAIDVPADEPNLSGDRVATDKGDLIIHPVSHASFLMQWNGATIHVDPVGGAQMVAALPKADLVLITHLHADHFDLATLAAILSAGNNTVLFVPPTVAKKLPQSLRGKVTLRVLRNGERAEAAGILVAAVPAYNTTAGREKFHPKGRDNGYLLTMGGKKVYVAGDTEDTAEMRALTEIDVAFLPMNLPYTMSVEQAADAIRQFRPKLVYPYHFRNGDGTKSDLERLRELVGAQNGVQIRTLDWYPE